MDLRELQRMFLAAVRYPTGVDDFLAASSESTREAFRASLVSTPGLSRRERVSVYAESHFWRLLDVLGEQYRVVAWLVGRRRFHNLVTDFLWERPRSHPNARIVGRGFPEFIAGHAISSELEGVDELALVERSIVNALDAPDQPALDEGALAARALDSWPSMRLEAAPWVRLWTTRRSFPRMLAAQRAGASSPDPPPPLDGDAHHVLVWRQRLEVMHRPVQAVEAAALSRMLAGERFDRVCEASASAGPEQVVRWLRDWLRAGLITGMRERARR